MENIQNTIHLLEKKSLFTINCHIVIDSLVDGTFWESVVYYIGTFLNYTTN